MPFANGATKLQLQNLSGSGLYTRRFGTDGMMINSTTGAHPRKASLMLGGVGIRDTGIIVATFTRMYTKNGTDSSLASGSTMLSVFQSILKFQEARRSVDHSISSRNSDSQPLSHKRNYQDAKLVKARRLSSSCGPTMPHVDSLEENSLTTNVMFVRLESHILGRE